MFQVSLINCFHLTITVFDTPGQQYSGLSRCGKGKKTDCVFLFQIPYR